MVCSVNTEPRWRYWECRCRNKCSPMPTSVPQSSRHVQNQEPRQNVELVCRGPGPSSTNGTSSQSSTYQARKCLIELSSAAETSSLYLHDTPCSGGSSTTDQIRAHHSSSTTITALGNPTGCFLPIQNETALATGTPRRTSRARECSTA